MFPCSWAWDGTFQVAVEFGVGDGPTSVAIGDLDGDGNQDLVVTNYWQNTVSLLPGSGDGSFGSVQNHQAGGGPSAVTIGDLDGDGQPDLADLRKP